MLTPIQKQAGVAILIPERVDFGVRKVIRDKEGRDKMKGPTRQNSP